MRVIRRQAYQAHAVPATAGYPRGPFNPEILAAPVIDHDPMHDDHDFPFGATAQNDFQGEVLYRCRLCEDVLTQDDLDSHRCEVSNGED